MNDPINDAGGPAFPIQNYQYTAAYGGAPGMTLRDYFAAKALPSALANERRSIDRYGDRSGQDHVPSAAKEAYRIADAMLAARVGSK